MKKYLFNNMEYELIEDENNIFDYESLKEKVTDYFNDYDYIFGDQAYNKIRLKGFYESNNKKAKDINDIKNVKSYKKDLCAYGCNSFLLKKVK